MHTVYVILFRAFCVLTVSAACSGDLLTSGTAGLALSALFFAAYASPADGEAR